MRPLLSADLLYACLLLATPAWAQTESPPIPRTAEGKPDFQGVWESRWRTQFNRPPTSASAYMTEGEHAEQMAAVAKRNAAPGMTPVEDMDFTTWMPSGDGRYRTSQVTEPADGSARLTEAGDKLLKESYARIGAPADGAELRPNAERCLSGVGGAPLGANGYREIVQTADHLLIQTEMIGEHRIVAINGSHRPSVLRSFAGDSIARWDGDTLVVTTTHARADDIARPPGFVVRPEATVTEWFRLGAADRIDYSFTIDDPEVYAQPWRADFIMIRSADRVYETACHENNYSLRHILQAARREDDKAR